VTWLALDCWLGCEDGVVAETSRGGAPVNCTVQIDYEGLDI